DYPFQNEAMTKKKLNAVMALVYSMYGQDKTAEIADDLKDLGFEYATLSGLSMGMDDFSEIGGMDKVMDEAAKRVHDIGQQYEQGFITDEERYRLTVDTWFDAESNVMDKLEEQFVEED